jgi:hypothetical protein
MFANGGLTMIELVRCELPVFVALAAVALAALLL